MESVENVLINGSLLVAHEERSRGRHHLPTIAGCSGRIRRPSPYVASFAATPFPTRLQSFVLAFLCTMQRPSRLGPRRDQLGLETVCSPARGLWPPAHPTDPSICNWISLFIS